jgi:hypothetical protein
MQTIRNLHGVLISVSGDDRRTGHVFIGAQRSEHPFVAYVYRAPETGKTYVVDPRAVEALGRIVYAIANQTTEYLEGDEAKTYADPDGEDLLCDLGRAYSIWCTKYHAVEGTRCDVEV